MLNNSIVAQVKNPSVAISTTKPRLKNSTIITHLLFLILNFSLLKFSISLLIIYKSPLKCFISTLMFYKSLLKFYKSLLIFCISLLKYFVSRLNFCISLLKCFISLLMHNFSLELKSVFQSNFINLHFKFYRYVSLLY